MSGYQVDTGALAARAGTVDGVADRVAGEAGAVRGVDTGGMPPKTAAALDSALAAWPGALRRLARALNATGSSLRASAHTYQAADDGVATATRKGQRP
jgi:uncharacterized protein YukE